MKVSEAIKILRDALREGTLATPEARREAMELGLGALEMVEQTRLAVSAMAIKAPSLLRDEEEELEKEPPAARGKEERVQEIRKAIKLLGWIEVRQRIISPADLVIFNALQEEAETNSWAEGTKRLEKHNIKF